MATPPNPLLRVATSGAEAKCKNYSNSPATLGHVLTATGEDTLPVWGAPPVAGDVHVSNILFVDAGAAAVGQTGSLSHPFTSIQPAIAALVVAGAITGTIRIATATYIDPIAIPIGLAVAFQGWDPQNPVILSGDITIVGGIGSSDKVTFENCTILAANITAADPLTQDIKLSFDASECLAVITGFNISCEWRTSTQLGAINAGGGLTTSWDDWSWARPLNAAPVFTVAGSYDRSFWGTGHDIYERNVTVAAVAIGTTAFQSMAVPAYVRAGDAVSIQVENTAVRDFICGIHGVDDGAVVVWLTNLSRVSTDFDEEIRLLIHHNDMIVEP
jgi:hypothetical protein